MYFTQHLADMLLRMRREVAVDDPSCTIPMSQNVDSLIIIDRSADLITPLCTQLTYEGLIDEVFGIRASQVELDSSSVGISSSNPAISSAAGTSSQQSVQLQPIKKRKIPLNSGDKLFAQLRDMNFSIVG